MLRILRREKLISLAAAAVAALTVAPLLLASSSTFAAPAKRGANADADLVSVARIPGFTTPAVQEASILLYAGKAPAQCVKKPIDALPADERDASLISCMLHEKYAADPAAQTLATDLYDATGSVAGLGEPEVMNGGYRGMIKLLPQLPTGAHRKHLEWVVRAMRDYDAFFTALVAPSSPAPAAAAAATPAARPVPTAAPRAASSPSSIPAASPALRFRWKHLSLRFVRSAAPKRTPSAYAVGWSVTYNVRGSLLTTAAGVSETLFHEIFHLNDFDHGGWSTRALADDYAAILTRCPTRTRACLAPYAPGTTTVRGGTYYAFQPNNGDSIHEYAAELALRYFKEHAELAATGKLSRPAFKCGAPENARAYRALADEFFAGIDKTGPCT